MSLQIEPQFQPTAPINPWQILCPDGALAPGTAPPMTDEEVLEALHWMMLSRAFDQKGFALQRQGRFGVFSPVQGQEASVVGSAMALDPGCDWVVPQYRELPALLRQGLPLERFMAYFMGNPEGSRIPDDVNVLPIQISLATQLPHAAGLAWGLKLQGKDGVVITYFGDGASSEGDFHEACNLAGVMQAPVVFFLQNNGWAISTPRSRQSAAATLAQRAPGYGFPGVVVDGNDLFAVYKVTSQAVERARQGLGPTLIESQTYRMGAHNTTDDPNRYVDASERERWLQLDPIARVQRYLTKHGWWDQDAEAAMQERVAREIDDALEAALAFPTPSAAQLFQHVYATPSPRLERERAQGLGEV